MIIGTLRYNSHRRRLIILRAPSLPKHLNRLFLDAQTLPLLNEILLQLSLRINPQAASAHPQKLLILQNRKDPERDVWGEGGAGGLVCEE